MAAETRLRRLTTEELTPGELADIRALLEAAFGPKPDDRFSETDWAHVLPGKHFIVELGGQMVAFASVAERPIEVDGRPFRTGYVEAVATAPVQQGRGLGTRVMSEVSAFIKANFELGALGTGAHHFYERLGWQTWQGPSFVRTADGLMPTSDQDGYIMVLLTGPSADLDVTKPISCDWRPGDAW